MPKPINNSQDTGSVLKTGFWQGCKGNNFIYVQAASSGKSPGQLNGAVLLLPPFADEMNKCRHLLNQLMRNIAQLEYDCYLPDHYGTGDSEGDLNQTTTDIWRRDLQQLLLFITRRGYTNISFIALRFGTLQLFDLLAQHTLDMPLHKVVLWQPILDTGKFWQHFVRIKVAQSMQTRTAQTQASLEQHLAQGSEIEIAGYPVNFAFYNSLLQMQCGLPSKLHQAAMHWFDTSVSGTLSVAIKSKAEQWSQYVNLNIVALNGEPYWNATELVMAPALLKHTTRLFQLAQSDV